MKNYGHRFLHEITKNKKYFVFSLFLSTYVFGAQIIIYDSKQQLLSTLISIFVLFLFSKLNKLAFASISLFVLVFTSVVLHITLHWGAGNLPARMQAVLLSPAYEIEGYIRSYFNGFDIAIILYIFLGLFFLYLYLSKYKATYHAVKHSSLLLLTIAIVIVSKTNYLQAMAPYSYIPDLIEASAWKVVLTEREAYLASLNYKQNSIKEGVLKYDKVVVVMGESVNKHHMGVYGYKVPTTPFLTRLVKNENNAVFNNVISPSNQTRYAIPVSLTGATVKSFDDFVRSKSVISIFKEYGYKTYWLSNQYMAGMHDSYVSSIANEADVTRTSNFVYEAGGRADSSFDMILLDYLEDAGIDGTERELYFFHLLGSHFQYTRRYPEGSGVYPNPANTVEEYDNTVHYTDTLLGEIYNKFKGKKTLFVYIADHAEVVDIDKRGHGFSPPFKDEFDIPLIVLSSEYNERLVEMKKANDKELFNAESFSELLQYLAGVASDRATISNRSQVISLEPNNVVDYDSLATYP